MTNMDDFISALMKVDDDAFSANQAKAIAHIVKDAWVLRSYPEPDDYIAKLKERNVDTMHIKLATDLAFYAATIPK